MRIVADDELAGPHQTVVRHHLMRDSRFRVMKALNAETIDLLRVSPRSRPHAPGSMRLMVIEQHEHLVRIPHPRQAILEARLQREIVHRLRRMVVAHRAVDARFDDIPGMRRRCARLFRVSSFSAMVCGMAIDCAYAKDYARPLRA